MRKHASVVAAVATAALLIGAGVGLAADGDDAKAARCQALLERVAEKRGVSVEDLKAQAKQRALDRIAKALAEGRITQARADEARARVEAGTVGCGRLVKRAKARVKAAVRGVVIRASAEYLGMEPADVRAQLRSGKSLADLAAAAGKTVDGLEAAIAGAFEERLERATMLTEEQRAKLLERFRARLDEIVSRVRQPQAA